MELKEGEIIVSGAELFHARLGFALAGEEHRWIALGRVTRAWATSEAGAVSADIAQEIALGSLRFHDITRNPTALQTAWEAHEILTS